MSEVDITQFTAAAEGTDPMLEPASPEEVNAFKRGIGRLGL